MCGDLMKRVFQLKADVTREKYMKGNKRQNASGTSIKGGNIYFVQLRTAVKEMTVHKISQSIEKQGQINRFVSVAIFSEQEQTQQFKFAKRQNKRIKKTPYCNKEREKSGV